MGSDAFHVFFGVRFVLHSEREISALEDGTDPRLLAAKKAGLRIHFDRPTGDQPYFLLIGNRIGTFGVENQVDVALSEPELQAITTETKRRLAQAQFDPAEARFYFQLEAQY